MIEKTIAEVLEARRPRDLFGPVTDEDELKKAFRKIARVVHPDRTSHPQAPAAFDRLKKLRDAGDKLLAAGTYATSEEGVEPPIVFATKTRRYEVSARPVYLNACAHYAGHVEREPVVVKVARSPRENDLLAREGRTLHELIEATEEEHRAFLPRYLESFTIKGKVTRQGLAFRATPNLYSLDDVRSVYPTGIDPRDMAWMFRRLLFALSLAHNAGFVHGAVLPEHVLIEPDAHGLVLVDWKYAVPRGAQIKAIPAGRRAQYPPEVFEKQPASEATDIWMAVATMRCVLEPATELPPRLRSFLAGCQLRSPKARPDNALVLLREFDELLERMYGPRKFRAFTMNPQAGD